MATSIHEEGKFGRINSLTPTFFIEVHVPSKESGRSCICMLGISILHLSTILIFDVEIVPTVWHFLVFRFISKCNLTLNYIYRFIGLIKYNTFCFNFIKHTT